MPPVFVLAELALTALVLAAALRWSMPTLGAAALAGSGAILVPLLLTRWTTPPYYVLCGSDRRLRHRVLELEGQREGVLD